MAFSPEFMEAYLAYQQDEKAFLARKAHFLESLDSTPEKLGARVLAQLREDEEALKARRLNLLQEFKEVNGFDMMETREVGD